MTLPGLPVTTGDKTIVDRVARLEQTIRNMQKEPTPPPISTDLHFYGDKISTGPRYLATPITYGAASTSGQLYSQYVGTMPNDMVFSSLLMYTSVANSATASLGVFTGPALNSMTLQTTVTPTLANTTVSVTALPSQLIVPRATYLVVCLLLNTGSSLPSLGGFSPTNGGCAGLVGSGVGGGSAKFASTGVSMPTTADFTTGYNLLTTNLWVAFQ